MSTGQNNKLRLPAEWEPVDAVLMAWPHGNTDWAYMLDEVRQTYIAIISAISERAKVVLIGPELPDDSVFPPECRTENIIRLAIPTNDTWTRDYGPLTVEDSDGKLTFRDYIFNGWGQKFASNHDNMATARLHTELLDGNYSNELDFVLEGGSIESDGNGLILTTATCLLAPNRNDKTDQYGIETRLMQDFGARKVLWLKHGQLAGDDTDGHVDTLARLAPPGDVIFYTGCSDPDDEHYAELCAMRSELESFTTVHGTPFNLVELPLPDPVYDPDDGSRLPATYANFLIVNGAVLLPTYGQAMKDTMAEQLIQTAMPEYEIITIDCKSLVRQHGSLHCATMQLPVGALRECLNSTH